ncbi:polysaccharide biosynthesis/export family protein [Lunatibacter salilacus]|uniref:polysaccharide biosynthesis/export family protein n=1 Tax=Lunatibacter salilacus TaxID=2483804 RepID=UPI00131D3116|nr:polysaccharide biosynthesis/export family protein [Lunatibacter salilacus]
MQELGEEDPLYEELQTVPYKTENYFLQYNDVVEINIRTTSPELNELFEVSASQGGNMAGQGLMNGGDIFFMTGFTLDEEGNVELPLLGEINLKGLTTQEAKEAIEDRLTEYVNREDLFVRVRLGGIRFSALGEFGRNGNFTILQNQITIFQAIAHAGDMTTIAKRNRVILVRQYPEGTKTYRVNLNDRRLLSSEFFFIRPNDMLYAEPMKIREFGTGVTFVQTFQLAVTTLSAVLLVLNALN